MSFDPDAAIAAMRYNGGKKRIAAKLAEIINALSPRTYWEPFCGMCSVGRLVMARDRFFSDLDVATVAVVNAAESGFPFPEHVTEEDYRQARSLPPENPLHGFYKYGCSFAGKPWGGFARDAEQHNYAAAAKNVLSRYAGQGIKADCFSYHSAPSYLLNCDVVYCDPPYQGTTSSGDSKGFDSDSFWKWASALPAKHVFVSEYRAPDGFVPVFTKEIKSGLIPTTRAKNVETLFYRKAVLEVPCLQITEGRLAA